MSKTTFPTQPSRGQHQNIHWNPWIFCIVYPIGLLSRPFDLIFVLCTMVFQQSCGFFQKSPGSCGFSKNDGFCRFSSICQDPQKPQLSVKIHKNCCFCVPNSLNWVHNTKIRPYGLEKESIGYTIIKLGQMVLKGVNWVHNDKIRSNGLERSQLGTQYKNQVIWSWKESIGYTMIKLGQMVLKGVIWVYNTKIK